MKLSNLKIEYFKFWIKIVKISESYFKKTVQFATKKPFYFVYQRQNW